MIKLAIDLGSWVTKIYKSGCGVVLCEATCAAIEQLPGSGRYTVKFLGEKARALSGRAAQNTHIINPVVDGDIIHEDIVADLLRYFLEKIEISPRKARKTEVVFVLPCGAKPELKRKYFALADECNIGKVHFTQTPFAAVLGHNVQLSESTPVFSVDIGYGLTNIAAFSLDGVIAGMSLNLGGGNIDVHLMDLMAENYNLRIGALTAEKLKNTVGSFLPDDNKLMVVDGRDAASGAPASVAVTTPQIYDVLTLYVDKIIEYIVLTISRLPAEVASAVMHGGIYLSGGLCKMDGIADYFSKKLKITVNTFDEPALASVIGGGMIVSSDYFLHKVATQD
ncbi:MAG TPA: rod shape-determining protein [Candidatus Coproplasma excrementavium]|nr:rod shape-determining protein [Candidatus Coproplasma excrementavium]